MKRLLTLTILLTLVAQADSGPSLSSLDRRERAHYNNLDKRLRLLTQLYLNGPEFTVEFASMTPAQNSTGATFYTGIIDCPNKKIAVGGGTDWAFDTPRGDWVVNYSHPATGGGAWEAGVFAGQARPATAPRVYAVCLGH